MFHLLYVLGDAVTETGHRFTVTHQTLFIAMLEMASSLYVPTMDGIETRCIQRNGDLTGALVRGPNQRLRLQLLLQ